MKQKLYALDAFFIEKLKFSENDPKMYYINAYHEVILDIETSKLHNNGSFLLIMYNK